MGDYEFSDSFRALTIQGQLKGMKRISRRKSLMNHFCLSHVLVLAVVNCFGGRARVLELASCDLESCNGNTVPGGSR